MKCTKINRNPSETTVSPMGQELFKQKEYRNLPVNQIRTLSQGVEYRNQPKVQIQFMLSDPSISDGSYRLFQYIYMGGYFDDDFSITQPKKVLAKALNTSVSSINRRLKELEVAGYINVVAQKKSSNECLPSKIAVDLPEPLVELLKAAPVRKRSAIKKCGTVDKNPTLKGNNGTDIGTSTSEGSLHSSVRSTPYIYNTHENNNTTEADLVNQDQASSNKPVVVFSDLASETSSPEPIASTSYPINSVSSVEDDDVGIDFFGDEGGDVVEQCSDKKSARAKIQRNIITWQKELDCLPSINDVQGSAEQYSLLKRSNTLDVWISQGKNKLNQLDKPVKRDHLKLANGERRLTQDHCDKINKVLLQSYKANKITVSEGRKTARSMLNAILHGYYRQQKVGILKSLNSVLLKFEQNSWDNNKVDRDKPSRPQPDWFDASKYRNNKIKFSGILKNVN